MTFGESIRYGFKNYANFSGVVGRSTYWYWYLFTVLCLFPVSLLQQALSFAALNTGNPMLTILSIPLGLVSWALFIPSLALMIRRLRDAGHSPLYLLLWLAPIVLAILFAIIGGVIGAAASSESYTSGFVVAGAAAIGALTGAILGGLAAGIWLIVLLAQPTKYRAQGNKYALQ